MRFGMVVPQGWKLDLRGVPAHAQWETILGVAGRAEAAGYDSVWVYDHFHTVPEALPEATFEAWTLMAALAAATDRIRLGQMCTCAGYRQASLLAKMASCVDVISGGRLEVGIGGGWHQPEYEAYGYDFPPARDRLALLRDTVQVLKAMWTGDHATAGGEHTHVAGAINSPRPLQDPHPPLWIAGAGEKVTLRIVAEEADYANFEFDVDHFVQRSEVLRRHCEAVGRPFSDVGRTFHAEVVIAATRGELAAKLDRIKADRGVDDEYLRVRGFIGTPDEVGAHYARLRDEGCVYALTYFADAVWGDGPELFAETVAAPLRD